MAFPFHMFRVRPDIRTFVKCPDVRPDPKHLTNVRMSGLTLNTDVRPDPKHRRLETLPQTAGRFHLNALLSIPFDVSSQMEVDLFCADARLAIELDGAQHLADANAYRRDRRKDALLQQNGYMVLRFLSEDVGKHLDDVLDLILRALTHQSAHFG
jgi:Protein of unknown function (DUF559)